jgi:hypothetical protein
MPSIHRALLGGVCALSMLAGCNQDVVSSDAGGAANPGGSGSGTTGTGTGTGNGGGSGSSGLAVTGGGATTPAVAVNATPSIAGTVSVIAGAKETITIVFTSASGSPISGLAFSNTTLPADWSGPSDFTCSVTDTGNDCVATLTYAPTAIETGTLMIGYVYVGDPTAPPGASLSIPYAGTASDNVVATPAPIGQIVAASGTGTQSVSVNFTTDDGNAATGLTMLSGLSSLPAGWSTTTPAFSCAIISNGNGCQLVLDYAPATAGGGTLTLNYAYTDHSGQARTGAINLPYSTIANGNVDATISPTGQINAIQKVGTQSVAVTFTTDNGQSASGLILMSPLSSLPAGWSSSTSDFTCGALSTGNSCQLTLSYAPAGLTSGTVQLNYGYMSPAGVFTSGSLNIPYAATTDDNVIATAAPSGQIDAVVAEVTPNVLVTFTTDDARTATALQLTTDLTALPAGWTSTDSSFSCAGVAGGTTCQLPLSYVPSSAASATMTLRYTYLDNAGQSKSGSLNIPYRATTDDSVGATPSPVSLAVLTGSSTALSITFVTDDGNPASVLSVTSGLAALPTGWSSADSGFTCSSVSAGVACQLALVYQPVNPDAGALTLGFSYTNDSGSVKNGTVSIPYAATAPVP